MKIDSKSLTDENRLLLSLCREPFGSEELNPAGLIGSNLINWDSLFSKAKYHRVVPFIYRNLSEYCPDIIPEAVLNKFKQEYVEVSKKSLYLSSVLVEILEVFHESGIEAIPLKGPALAYHLYGDITLRDFSDLDILIRKADLDKADQVLKDSGYSTQFQLTGHLRDYYLNSHYYYINYIKKDNQSVVDIHWATLDPNYKFSNDYNYYKKGIMNIDFMGCTLSVPGKEDLLVLLCVHGCKHTWERLGWMCDLADLSRSQHEIDFEYVIEEAKRLGCLKMVCASILIADSLFGCLSSTAAQYLNKFVYTYNKNKKFFCGMVFPDQYTRPSMLQQEFYFPLIMDDNRDKIIFFYNKFICPTPIEFSMIKLNRNFFGLYYILRISRIFYRFLRRITGDL